VIESVVVQENETSPGTAQALQSLAVLQQLTVEAGTSDNLKQLVFRMANRSIGYCDYDRAVVWDLRSRAPRLLAVSGSPDLNQHAPSVTRWRQLVRRIRRPNKTTLLDAAAFDADHETWAALAQTTSGLSVAWQPIIVAGETVAALWLERWGNRRFATTELPRIEALGAAYALAWRAVAGRPRRLLRGLRSKKGVVAGLLTAGVLAALWLVPVPLRIVAPCEIVPADPVLISAPIGGVIDEIPVLPGREVKEGDLLAVYDQRVAREEIKVARQQVELVESDLQRTRVQALDDPAARAEIALLENRLRQERVRLRVAEHRVRQLEVRAPVEGVLMFADAHAWRGRPVQVGERLMLIVDPHRTKVRVRLPQDDCIAFDRERPLSVILSTDPRTVRPARLRFVANYSEVGRDGVPYFRAEAAWLAPDPHLRMGLEGSAILYGENVSLGYWLIRRPLAVMRRLTGF
jgi:hypothetical protein